MGLYTVAAINLVNPKRTGIYPPDVVLQIFATWEIYAGRCRKNNAYRSLTRFILKLMLSAENCQFVIFVACYMFRFFKNYMH